jgi:type IV pilus assembly protein PilM
MAGPDNTSIWKKEITFGRKPKAEKVAAAPRAPEQPKPKPESVWKKEITFGRKPKAEEAAAVASPPESPRSAETVPAPPTSTYEQQLEPSIVPPITRAAEAPGPAPVPPVTPVAEPLDPAVLPPVTPAGVVSPAPLQLPVPAAPFEPAPRPEAAAEEETVVFVPEPEPEPEPVQPEPEAEVEQAPAPTRRERKDARRAADRLAKEQRKRTKDAAARERKAPHRTHKQVVGLKLGASQIAAAQVVNKGGPRIARLARMPIERGIVVGGELRSPDELTAALKTFFRRNKLPRNCVRLGISNNRIGVRTFEIKGIDDPKQLENAIRFRAQETLPIPLDEAVLDYRILSETVGEDGVLVRRVLLVVAHRELVERYVSACRKAGLKLIGIDLEAFALLRALSESERAPAASDDAGLVCVSIGHDRSTLAVSDGRVCEFTRVLPWGGAALDLALARVLDLTPSEAEPVKRELVLGQEGAAAGLESRRADEARAAMSAELQVFARELVASLRFYQEQPGSLGVGEILITGGGAACGGLADELGRLIGVPVRVADPLARVKLSRKVRSTNGSTGSLAVAVGLGIED